MRVQLCPPEGDPTALIPLDYLPWRPPAAGSKPRWKGTRPCVVLSLGDGELTAEPAPASWRTTAPIVDEDEIRWPIPQPLTTAAAATLLPELVEHAQAILDDTTVEHVADRQMRCTVGDLGRLHATLIEHHIVRRSQELPACETITVETWVNTKIDSDDALHPAWWRIDATDTDDDLARQARMIQAGITDTHGDQPLVVFGLLDYMTFIREHLRDVKRTELRRHGDELRALQDRMDWLTEQILPPLVHEIHAFGDDKTDSNRQLAEAAGVSHTEIGRWLKNPLAASRTRAAEGKSTATMLGDLAHVLERPDEMFDGKPAGDLAAVLRNHVSTFDTVLIDTPPTVAPLAEMPAAVLPFKGRPTPKTPLVDGEGHLVGSGAPASRTNDMGTLMSLLREKFGDIVNIDTDPPAAGAAGWPDRTQKRHGDEKLSTEDAVEVGDALGDLGTAPDLSDYDVTADDAYEWLLSDHPWARAERVRRAEAVRDAELRNAHTVRDWTDRMQATDLDTRHPHNPEIAENLKGLAALMRPIADGQQVDAHLDDAVPDDVRVQRLRQNWVTHKNVTGDHGYRYPAHLLGPGAAAYPPPGHHGRP
jgi:hypothetical protein